MEIVLAVSGNSGAAYKLGIPTTLKSKISSLYQPILLPPRCFTNVIRPLLSPRVCLRGHRYVSQLPQGTQVIPYGPALNNPTVNESEDLDCSRIYNPSRGWLSHVTTCIGCGGVVATHDHIAFGYHRLDFDSEIRQHRAQHGYDSLNVLRASRREWVAWIVAHIVWRNDFVCDRQVALSPQLLTPATDYRLVLFNRHVPSRA